MKIPSKLSLLGKTINIELRGKAWSVDKNSQCFGTAFYSQNKIIIYTKDCKGNKLCFDNIYETFLHEVCHFLLHELNSQEADNEVLIDYMANMLHQIIPQLEGTNKRSRKKQPKKESV